MPSSIGSHVNLQSSRIVLHFVHVETCRTHLSPCTCSWNLRHDLLQCLSMLQQPDACAVWQHVWLPPREGWVKYNIETNFYSSRCIGKVGRVFCDSLGLVLLCFAGFAGRWTRMSSLLTTVRIALQLVCEKGWVNLWIESSDLEIIDVARGQGVASAHYTSLASDVSSYLQRMNAWTCTQVPPYLNRVAHILARSVRGIHVMEDDIPWYVYHMVEEDAQVLVTLLDDGVLL